MCSAVDVIRDFWETHDLYFHIVRPIGTGAFMWLWLRIAVALARP